MDRFCYALGLHMHQPPGNLKLLIESNDWEAQQIIRCYERASRYAHLYKKHGCYHVGFSGILLEQFRDKNIIDRYRRFIDIPEMIEKYRAAKNIEIIGMGYFHPIFPLIPKEDWKEHLTMGREIIEEMFGQRPKGFWPSEMAFSMEMIPYLREAGYEYVIVDHVHVRPEKSSDRQDSFKPYTAKYEGAEIAVIPRNRDLSNAQESGLNPEWFINEAAKKLKDSPSDKNARLVTTWSDGENGGWFRQIDEKAGFFGYFYAPLIEMIKRKEADVQLVKMSDYLKKNPPVDAATVNTGAWNVASTSGYDFSQWNGSDSQKRAIEALFKTSRKYWELKNSKGYKNNVRLEAARRFILDAETSCYLFWGDAWIPKIYEKLDAAVKLLN